MKKSSIYLIIPILIAGLVGACSGSSDAYKNVASTAPSAASTENATPIANVHAPDFLLKEIGRSLDKDPKTITDEDLQKISVLILNGDTQLNESEKKDSSLDLSILTRMKNITTLSLVHLPLIQYAFHKEMKQLESLNVTRTNVRDIPLDHFPNLTYLSIDDGNLSDLDVLLPVSKSIKIIDIQDNPISSLDTIHKFINLEMLTISGDPISDISPVSEMNNLTRLQIADTKVTDLTPLQHLKKLQYLDARGTKVSSVSVLSGLKNLRYLLVDKSRITDLSSLDNNKELQITEKAILAE